jgi:hypothetical protein
LSTPTLRLVQFRATAQDLQNIERITETLRASGHTFATRSDAIRLSLDAAAHEREAMEGSK